MDNLEIARNRIMQSLIKHGVEMEEVSRDRMIDEYGNVGHGKFADKSVFFCDRGNLRLIFKECSDSGEYWFELEFGHVYSKADSVSSHSVSIYYPMGIGDEGAWRLERYESQESLALLEGVVDPTIVPMCATYQRAADRLAEFLKPSDRLAPDSPFFLDLVDKIIAKFAAS